MTTHLAIFRKEYLTLILYSKKKIEARFSKNRSSPYKKVKKGDLIYLKKTGGPIFGTVMVKEVKYFEDLTKPRILDLIEKYNHEIKIQPEFLEKKLDARYLTLIFLGKVEIYAKPFTIKKTDQRSWVTLDKHCNLKQTFLFQKEG